MIYESSLETESKIKYCEKLYSSQNLPVCFKITEISCPSGIDAILGSHGYSHEFDVSVQTMDIKKSGFITDHNAIIVEKSNEEWLDNYIKMNEVHPSKRPVLQKIIDTILCDKCLLTYRVNGIAAGCGLGVVEDKFIGLYDIVIDKNYRKKGWGKIMIENILGWGISKGAEMAYLQVLADNAPALRLYEKVGFKEEYKYWYRIKSL
jgi:ribosomal protein S18 acetylase RimI-like enzyme